MSTSQTINILNQLGREMDNWRSDTGLLENVKFENAWFVEEHVSMALQEWSKALNERALENWLENYTCKPEEVRCIGIVAAGNVPLVGLHDLLCVVAYGHRAKVKLSADDSVLMKKVIQFLNDQLNEDRHIKVVDQLKEIDAVIATGSTNTSRYFEYYFRHIPSVIRKNRSSAAVIYGDESTAELKALACDIYHYFGLGCRNVSKIYLPKNYRIEDVIDHCEGFSHYEHHHKYINNYTYHKAIYLMNQDAHLDNGFTLFRKNNELHAPLSVVHYDYYQNESELEQELQVLRDQLQIVVGKARKGYLPFGTSQHMQLTQYADNVNIMDFLHDLESKTHTKT